MARFTLILLVLLLAGGCAYQDFDKPLLRNYISDVIYQSPRPPETVRFEVQRFDQMVEMLKRWQAAAGIEEEYAIGGGDTLKLTVLSPGHPELGLTAEVAVAANGSIRCPLVGEVAVGGLTASEASRKLEAAYADGFVRNPQVVLQVVNFLSKRVLVAGSVVRPGVIYLRSNRSTLLEVLLQAGGISSDAGDEVVVTRSPVTMQVAGQPQTYTAPETVTVDLHALLANADLTQNVIVLAGDIVNVQPYRPAKVFVLGYVNNPGGYDIPRRASIGLLDAVAMARGPNASARVDKSVLKRKTAKGQDLYYVDLVRIASAEEADIVVQPGDVLFVGTSATRRFIDGVLSMLGFRTLAPSGTF